MFVDHWLSVEICFVTVGSLKRTKQMSWCKVLRSTTVAIQRKE